MSNLLSMQTQKCYKTVVKNHAMQLIHYFLITVYVGLYIYFV